MRKRIVPAIVLALVLLAAPASAHVTVQPTEAVAGSFARFVVRVPNERDDAATTKVELQMPESLVLVSFQPKPGWNRTVATKERSEPIEVFGEQQTEYTASVTWEGGEIQPGEFEEFGFSARMPAGEATLEFPALQTYSSGEVVEWIGPAESEEPAARVSTYRLGDGEQQPGQLELLSRLADEASSVRDDAAEGGDDDDDSNAAGIALGAIGTALAALALVVALTLRRRA